MKVYLVGGAVRDQLLGLPVKEKDWVVVGSSPEEMRAKKFKQVGKDFPVFIHTKTGEEYALARTERKSGHGYTGFEFDTNPNVTLEEDLERRDLTINAIAQDEDGTLIDPFNGKEDIKNKKLRHVSDAFSEDPLRVLRAARFKTNLPGFVIVPETKDKIKEIINSGELNYLTGERMWQEFYKANSPWIFSNVLEELNIHELILGKKRSDMDELINEITINMMTEGEKINKLQHIATFISCYNTNAKDINIFCDRLKVPNEYRDLALMFNNCYHDFVCYQPTADNHDELISLIKKLDIRKEERLQNFFEMTDYPDNPFTSSFLELIHKIKSFKLDEKDQRKSNKEIHKIIENVHREITKDHIKEYLNSKQNKS